MRSTCAFITRGRCRVIGHASRWSARWCNRWSTSIRSFTIWPHIKVKTLVLGGDKDGANFPERAKHIADSIPGAELVLIPGIGHVPHFEAPDLFYKALLKFLNSESSAPAQKPGANR